ncbi:helix-turn-helix domain-containing protein [Halobacteriales archaeon QH_2_65_14]|nr:MAG: helix-turn-helix domain-containing protein [Halobacteriales archaeon QH_2_65_14]
MSVIAEFRVWSSVLAMAETLDAMSDIEIDLVQQAGTDPNTPYLLFWVTGDSLAAFDEKLHDDATVTNVERYTKAADRVLYRARITEAADVVFYSLWVELGAEQIDVRYADGWWYNRMRLPDRDALATIAEWCVDSGVEFDLQAVYTDDQTAYPRATLTDEQREVLQVAHDLGYFDVPRSATLADVAAELGISSQAASERLRRGHRQLIAQHL